MDPSNGGKLNTDTRRVEELFRDAWQPVFNRPVNVQPPDWDSFESKYEDYLTPLVGIRDDAFDAHELAAQAARFNRGAVGGLDGWTPAEQKSLPIGAWEDRVHVEKLIATRGQYPDVYYQVPIPMLRKGEGRTPKEHRGFFIFVTN